MVNDRTLRLVATVGALLVLIATGGGASAQDEAGPEPSDQDVFQEVDRVHQLTRSIAQVFGAFALIHSEEDESPTPNLVVDVTGRNWSWDLAYRQADGELLDERGGSDAEPPRNRLVVPVDAVVRLNLTSTDVIHSLWIPGFGLKLDAIPGRLESSWFQANEIGVYEGLCAELCGL